ncbi:MAG: Fe2+-dependent dioxygenase [Gammaproteobacteria bacterium]|nr:MAG: Fe2+-dependent dioxygenase [Gammaproteobacteria bacterium]
MMLHIPAVLNKEQLKTIMGLLVDAPFVDGKFSAGQTARRVKNNRELDQTSQQAKQLDQLVISALSGNKIFRSATLPLRVSQPFFARYSKGMSYGSHIDDPVMGGEAGRYRSDISLTIFLNGPENYEGGELSIQSTFGVNEIKLPAGDVILYPSSSLHQVNTVTSGERIVSVLWIQSLVRDAASREILFNLDLAREKMQYSNPEASETRCVDYAYTNLVRMWSEV